ncbi:hypothetical protein [Isoptericola dokdonensis]|uniref:Uncharacterized protein n=1 Tax=Isoptericola dokdonensis DS-3 TaxID=1300344 RepID=A0A161II14_9MICO|nr:hypothetical protein [Isoptericola dokdonensis]ANC31434.1 hypothetical protein I598_1886 [Isoptericola dokdonensis DS-3]
MALARPDDVALLVGAASNDGKVQLALRRASARFEGEIGYSVERVVDDQVKVSGSGGTRLFLPGRPVVGDPVVTIAGEPVDDFEVNRAVGFLRRAAGWPDGEDNIDVTFTHGWPEDNIPGDIEDAVLEQAEAQYRAIAGVASATAGQESVTFTKAGVSQGWTDTVERYAWGPRP